MQCHQPPAGEARRKAFLQLRREVDFRHQHQGLAAARQHGVGGAQVDLGLAAAGDAEQQHRQWRAGCGTVRGRLAVEGLGHGVVHRHQGLGLLGAGFGRGGRRAGRRLQGRRGLLFQILAQPHQALRQLLRVQLAQLGRQHRQRQFTQAALVITGCKFDQRHPGRAQRWQGVEHLRHRAQFHAGVGVGGPGPDDAGHFTPAQRHTHQGAKRERPLTAVAERPAQPGMLGCVHRHAHGGPVHGAAGSATTSAAEPKLGTT